MKRNIILLNIILVITMFVSCQKDNFYDSISEEGTKVSFDIQFSDDAYDSDVELNPMSRAEVLPEYNDFCYNSSYFIILKKLPNVTSGSEPYLIQKIISNISNKNSLYSCKRKDVIFSIPSQVLQPGTYKLITIINGYRNGKLKERDTIYNTTNILQDNFYKSTRELYIGFKGLEVKKNTSLDNDAKPSEIIAINLDRYCTPLNLILNREGLTDPNSAYSLYYTLNYKVPKGINYNGELIEESQREFQVDEVYFDNIMKKFMLSKYSMQDKYLNAFIVTHNTKMKVGVKLTINKVCYEQGTEENIIYQGSVSQEFDVEKDKPAHVLFTIEHDGNNPSQQGDLNTNRDVLTNEWKKEFPDNHPFIPLNYQAYNEYRIDY